MRLTAQPKALAIGFATITLLAACSGKAGTAKSGESASSTATSLKQAQTTLERLYAGTDGTPPSDGPPAQRGKNVWIISCAEAAEGCALASKETKAAGDRLGWRVTVFDGKFNAGNAYSTGIRQAIAAKADGVILDGIDCADVQQAMQEAKSAGVKTVEAQSANDCPGKPLAGAVVVGGNEYPTPDKFAEAWGRYKASWVVAKLKGKGKILDVVLEGVSHSEAIDKGFLQVTASCPDCVVKKVPISLNDLSTSAFERKVANALLQNPDTAAITVPYDNLVHQGIAPAVAHSGNKNILVIGGEGLASNLALIRNHSGQSAVIAYDSGWLSWAAADTLNRLFAGRPAVPQNFGFTAVDLDHNLPTGNTAFTSKVDFRAAYQKVWSAS